MGNIICFIDENVIWHIWLFINFNNAVGYVWREIYTYILCISKKLLWYIMFHPHCFACVVCLSMVKHYRQISDIRGTISQTLKVSHPVLQLSFHNLLKPSVKSRMKM